jgi:hypothetical protein
MSTKEFEVCPPGRAILLFGLLRSANTLKGKDPLHQRDHGAATGGSWFEITRRPRVRVFPAEWGRFTRPNAEGSGRLWQDGSLDRPSSARFQPGTMDSAAHIRPLLRPIRWVDTMLAEEHGLRGLHPNPLKSAFVAFAAFVLIGVVPLVPLLVTPLRNAFGV